MNSKVENNTLYIFFEGKVDSQNAESVSSEIEKIISENEHELLVFDMEKLIYISSAGLRIVLKFKKADKSLRLVNVSSEVYEIFDMTGFTEMMNIEKAYRQLSVDGCKIIGQGAKGIIYRYDDETIVKVYKSADSLPDIKNERELAKRAFVLGIPTAISYDIVKVGENYGSVFELLDAKSYSQVLMEEPENRDKYITDYALLLKQIHSTAVNPEDMPDIKSLSRKWLKNSSSYLKPEIAQKYNKMIDAVPDLNIMLHCDFHTNNVMLQKGETLLIDMDTLSHGHPVFDLVNVYTTYVAFNEIDSENVEKFLGIPYEMSMYVWKKFIKVYLDTDDEQKIEEVENKVRLLSFLRTMHHLIKRANPDSDEFKEKIGFCTAEIDRLMKIVDKFEF